MMRDLCLRGTRSRGTLTWTRVGTLWSAEPRTSVNRSGASQKIRSSSFTPAAPPGNQRWRNLESFVMYWSINRSIITSISDGLLIQYGSQVKYFAAFFLFFMKYQRKTEISLSCSFLLSRNFHALHSLK